jgi:hypothetical protein
VVTSGNFRSPTVEMHCGLFWKDLNDIIKSSASENHLDTTAQLSIMSNNYTTENRDFITASCFDILSSFHILSTVCMFQINVILQGMEVTSSVVGVGVYVIIKFPCYYSL